MGSQQRDLKQPDMATLPAMTPETVVSVADLIPTCKCESFSKDTITLTGLASEKK